MSAMDHRQAVETLAIERYLLGEMSGEERDAFEEHFFSCADCAEDARAAGAMRDAVQAGVTRTASRPDGRLLELPPRPRRVARIVVPWAVAASLAVVAGYQALVVQPGLQRAAGPLVLSPVTLRPSSRGAEAEVLASGNVITLAVDLGSATVADVVAYEIHRADGASIASDRARVSNDGAPLLLLLPASLFKPGEHYVLALKDPRNGPLTLADYRFTVGVR
jgi:anti-sigma factor RsiW